MSLSGIHQLEQLWANFLERQLAWFLPFSCNMHLQGKVLVASMINLSTLLTGLYSVWFNSAEILCAAFSSRSPVEWGFHKNKCCMTCREKEVMNKTNQSRLPTLQKTMQGPCSLAGFTLLHSTSGVCCECGRVQSHTTSFSCLCFN